jgi:hypothetical protein
MHESAAATCSLLTNLHVSLSGAVQELSAVSFASPRNFAAFAINQAKSDRTRRLWDFVRCSERSVRIGGGNLEFVEYAGPPEETNAVNLQLARHSQCLIPRWREPVPRWRSEHHTLRFIGVAPNSLLQ